MNISSFIFFLFVFGSLFLYYILPKKVSYVSLLIFSLIFLFYNSLTITNIVSVVLIFLIAYISGLLISKSKRRSICVLAILFILLILGYLKYTNFFITLINNLFRLDIPLNQISAPIGISYFALIMIGYIVDTYWGSNEGEKNPLRLLLFMIYYPILTSGPFIKYNEIKDELFTKNSLKIDNILNGFLRVLWGLLKC